MRALVTGGNGFIGSHLVDALVAAGHEVIVLDRVDRLYDALPARATFVRGDISDPATVTAAMRGVDVVYHLSWANVHEASNADPAADVQVNLVPTINLVEASRNAQVRRFVFLSSGGTVYGLPRTLPTPESHPQEPLSAYGITKLAVEKYLHLYRTLHDFDYVVLRPSVPYGPRQNPLGRQGAVAVFMHRIATGVPITIWGDPGVSRDFFYIADLIEALVGSATNQLGIDRTFNIAGQELLTLHRLITHIEHITGRQAQIQMADARKFDAPHIHLDTSLASRCLGWQPATSIQEGLARTWQWMKSVI